MSILFNHEVLTVDRHKFTVSQGGKLDVRISNGSDRHVTIIFKNGKFDSVEWNIADETFGKTRSAWWVRGAIAEKIKELEDHYSSSAFRLLP